MRREGLSCHVVVLSVLTVLALSGCGIVPVCRITGSGRLAAVPPGRLAVLRVTADEPGPSRTGLTTWGSLAATDVAVRFAERLAYVAADDGGLDVMGAAESRRLLDGAGLDPAPDPGTEDLCRCARALGLAAFLTAHVQECRVRYVFVWSWATAEFDVTCTAAEDGTTLWQVHVLRRQRLESGNQAMTGGLRAAFRWLREQPEDGERG